MAWYEMIFTTRGWPDEPSSQDGDESLIQRLNGLPIVSMKQSVPGYWDIEFEDGTKLDAIHTMHIIPSGDR